MDEDLKILKDSLTSLVKGSSPEVISSLQHTILDADGALDKLTAQVSNLRPEKRKIRMAALKEFKTDLTALLSGD